MPTNLPPCCTSQQAKSPWKDQSKVPSALSFGNLCPSASGESDTCWTIVLSLNRVISEVLAGSSPYGKSGLWPSLQGRGSQALIFKCGHPQQSFQSLAAHQGQLETCEHSRSQATPRQWNPTQAPGVFGICQVLSVSKQVWETLLWPRVLNSEMLTGTFREE